MSLNEYLHTPGIPPVGAANITALQESLHAAGIAPRLKVTGRWTPAWHKAYLTSLPGQHVYEFQGAFAGQGTDQHHGHYYNATHANLAVVPKAPAATALTSQTPVSSTSLSDPTLNLLAEVVDDLERTRIANENRLRQLTRDEADKDGLERGFGLTLDHPDVARLAGIVDGVAALEHQAVLNLARQLRAHPLGAWIKAQVGIGAKQGARLLAAIGDPYWNTLYDRPRTVSELWAYCGLHVLPASQTAADLQTAFADGAQISHPDHPFADAQNGLVGVAAKRRKGQRANWSTTAKMRAYLVASSCIKKAASPYRPVYDQRRAHTAVTHPEWTPGHSHNDALRVVSKAILRDLWIQARAIHEEAS